MKNLVRGDDPAASFAALFPDLTPAAIDQLLHDSISRFPSADASEQSVLLEPYERTLLVHTLPPAELHAQLGSLFEFRPGLADRTAALPRARAEFARSLELDPGEPDALHASLLLDRAPAAAWLQAARRAVELHPDRRKSQQLLVLALEDETPPQPEKGLLARHDERLEAAQKAAVLAPFEPAAQAGLAKVLVRRGRLDDALPAALQAVAIDPSDPTALSDLAVILAALHRNHEALGVAQRVLEAVPENASPHFHERMKGLRKQPRTRSSSCSSTGAPRDTPPSPTRPQSSPAEVHAQLAALFANGPPDDWKAAQAGAEDEALASLKLDPGNPEALGTLYRLRSAKGGDLRQAALQINPENAEEFSLEVSELLSRKRAEGTLPVALHAVALDPVPDILAALARTQLALHHWPEATAAVARALELTDVRASKQFVDGLHRLQTRIAEEGKSSWTPVEDAGGAPAAK